VLDPLPERVAQDRGLQHRQAGHQVVVAPRSAGRSDGPIGADEQRRQRQHCRHVLVLLVDTRVDHCVGEPHQRWPAVGVEPDVAGVDRTVTQAPVVQLAELCPQRVEHGVVDIVGGDVAQRVVEGLGDEHCVVVRRHPDADEIRHRHAGSACEQQRQRLVLHLLAAVRPVLRALLVAPSEPPQPRPPPRCPRVTAEHTDQHRLPAAGPGEHRRRHGLICDIVEIIDLQAQIAEPITHPALRRDSGGGTEHVPDECGGDQPDEDTADRIADGGDAAGYRGDRRAQDERPPDPAHRCRKVR